MHPAIPRNSGLYRPEFEHDACGVGFVCDVGNNHRHDIVADGVLILNNLVHRGAAGADPTTGDGAGLLIHLPHELFVAEVDFELPPAGDYGVGMCFLPQQDAAREAIVGLIEAKVAELELKLLGWRRVPVASDVLNATVRSFEPVIAQVFVAPAKEMASEVLNLKLYFLRRWVSQEAKRTKVASADPAGYYMCSFSTRTIVYKGMFLADQLQPYYPDLADGRTKSAIALVHQRFSTNTFPSWKLAHPYRLIAHNGEINTVRGNINNMLAREKSVANHLFGAELAAIHPLVADALSDSGSFDNCLDLLVSCGYSPAHAVAMMIPEAWQNHAAMAAKRRAFYEAHAVMMEPWDGPALITFTDGNQIGALLDRNGLRPARYIETTDDRVVMGSESGVLPVPEEQIRHKWRLEPGRMLLVDLARGAIVSDEAIKEEFAGARPFGAWNDKYQLKLAELPVPAAPALATQPDADSLLALQIAHRYTAEEIKFLLEPMVANGQEPVGSMGDDTPQAVLSTRARKLSDYFRQEFAQVTNPAIDPIREELVMGTNTYLGRRPNLLEPNTEPEHKLLALDTPVLTLNELEAVVAVKDATAGAIGAKLIDVTYPAAAGYAAMEGALDAVCAEAAQIAAEAASVVLVLTDRASGPKRVAIPTVLALSAVHHRLIDEGLRTRVGLVVDTAQASEVHDFAVMIGFGAEAVCPYLAYWTIGSLRLRNGADKNLAQRVASYRAAVRKGLLKVMSKMGVSTIQSFCGAQLFELIGLSSAFVERYFARAVTQIEGIGISEIAQDALRLHERAYGPGQMHRLDQGGEYAYRESGEEHLWTPRSIAKLQHAVRADSAATYAEYAELINAQSERQMTLRGMLRFAVPAGNEPLALDQVEPAAEIVKRFSTGAMSFGSISEEAHTTLAIAMNRIGGKSNTGEGGEEPARFVPLANGDSMRSAIKQVASGRFGVTAEYLVNSDMMQIKIAQGAKPGEGGQLPGHKVDATIAKVRHSVPGVGLISPPPHHDIYSIEDIAQLIHDLKNVNPQGDVSVKLVSRYGVGTVAAGVTKAKSDHITIAGHDGGTGASPLSSIKHAGTPWELGLSETHQTLLINHLRSRVAVQVDGQLKTGRDVAIGALLGADEFGFATAPLVAEGCLMMRKCHLNTCPVGIATQDPRLRAKFAGKPEHVVNYFFFVAEEVRKIMAELGFARFDDMIGRCDALRFTPPANNPKAAALDLSAMLAMPEVPAEIGRYHSEAQDHGLERALDHELMKQARPAIERGEQVAIATEVTNANRTVGTIISGEVAKRHGHAGLADDTLVIDATGSVGQSFGCFLAKGVTLNLVGDANDYCGKGLSGGIVALRPPEVGRADGANIITGNVNLYGAIAGEAYFRGVAGERFAVRNSGAHAVIEGAGDHCCEYMTGGTVVVLGPVGRNFAAGMSGGVAYVYDEDGSFEANCNLAMVELEKPSAEVAVDSHRGRDDITNLRELLQAHARRTGSPQAAAILADWERSLGKFVKVMPTEYRRALLEMAGEDARAVAG